MRIPVLAGLLACALIFIGSSQKAEAVPLDLLANNTNQSTAVDELQALINEEPIGDSKRELKPLEHIVKESETLSLIAEQYAIDWKLIFYKNESIKDPNSLETGDKLVIPSENEDLKEREIPVQAPVSRIASTRSVKATSSTPATHSYPAGSSAGNLYDPGNCTWYVKSRRPDLPNNLGNANTWAARAAGQGYATGSTPRVGAAAQSRVGMHIVYVTAVNGDGTVAISEMNRRNLYEITSRIAPASSFIYIY